MISSGYRFAFLKNRLLNENKKLQQFNVTGEFKEKHFRLVMYRYQLIKDVAKGHTLPNYHTFLNWINLCKEQLKKELSL
jgi:hypothetical protein